MKKRSNRWVFECRGRQYKEAVSVRFSPIVRAHEEVTEPDGTVTSLQGPRFGLCYVDVEMQDETEAFECFKWLTEVNQQYDTLAVNMMSMDGLQIMQTYELENVIPIQFTPGAMDRYQKNTFHSDNVRFVGNIRRIVPA